MAVDKKRATSEAADGNVKETIESILVAFILAFIFRAFVVEAFVIPTGSMAPTLYGAHMRLHCPDCGYTYDVGFKDPSSGEDDTSIPSWGARTIEYHCPNCGYAYPRSVAAGTGQGYLTDQAVRFGDRILVLKYLYQFQSPKRWDVVVFKAPVPVPHDDPVVGLEYPQNYIKRLAGKPGESLVILDGSVYTGPKEADVQFHDRTVSGFEAFHIQRRPDYVQDRLWRIVADNDYLPHLDRSADDSQRNWRQPWVAEPNSGWSLMDAVGRPSRTFSFDNAGGTGRLEFDPQANPDQHALTDWLVYDEKEQGHSERQQKVGDLKLALSYTRKSGDGSFAMQLTKRGDAFTARFSKGKVSLTRGAIQSAYPLVTADTWTREVNVPELNKTGVPIQLELQNTAYRVTVKVNGKSVLTTTDAEYTPDVKQLLLEADANASPPTSQVAIIADHQSGSISHLSLWRDIYYRNNDLRNFWGSPWRVVHLGEGEFFVLGDNSYISGDARYWFEPSYSPVRLPAENLFAETGRVPERFMLGKAFFVYWPAGYQPSPFIPINIAPDFGEMRFIH